jgi:tRNA threonylcarbamoyladenosine biosynthesis protein TsaB
MALILYIETATEVCSVVLANEKGVIDSRENTEGRSHASVLTLFIEDILKTYNISARQLDAIAVSSGPGSYTGLRIGVSVAKGICYGANLPLIAVPTLQSMACGFIGQLPVTTEIDDDTWYCPMIDARRLEVYTALYNRKGDMQSETSAQIIDENSFAGILSVRKIFFFGNGSDKCREIITHPNAKFHPGFVPSAKDMVKTSEKLFHEKKFEDVAYFEPYYLKDFMATIPKNKVLK